MSGQTVQHVGRVVRLVLFTLLSSALFVNTVNAWAVRYPLIGVGLALLEVLYRTAVPVETVESLTSAVLQDSPTPTVADGDATLRTHPGYGMSMQGTTVAPGQTGTIANPPIAGQPPATQITSEG